jgi:predicted acetyltransferase
MNAELRSHLAPTFSFRVAEWHDRPVLMRMVELYQYDLSDIWPQDLNMHGEYGFAVDRYLRNPRLSAILFLANDKYAGFGLVDPDVTFLQNHYWMGQFFVMKRYRRAGLGTRAACFIFDRFPGRWEVGQMRRNRLGQAFWRRTIGEYTSGRFVEHDMHDQSWDGFIQCFDNSSRKSGA